MQSSASMSTKVQIEVKCTAGDERASSGPLASSRWNHHHHLALLPDCLVCRIPLALLMVVEAQARACMRSHTPSSSSLMGASLSSGMRILSRCRLLASCGASGVSSASLGSWSASLGGSSGGGGAGGGGSCSRTARAGFASACSSWGPAAAQDTEGRSSLVPEVCMVAAQPPWECSDFQWQDSSNLLMLECMSTNFIHDSVRIMSHTEFKGSILISACFRSGRSHDCQHGAKSIHQKQVGSAKNLQPKTLCSE